MNEAPLISAIVPVYTAEPYLDRCVESIVDQTYKNLEIILVDDGSLDNCPATCDAWAEKDSRVRMIHKENGNVASARNVALDNAVGQYISFVDSDDWIDSTMIAELVSCAAEYHTDVTGMLYRIVYSNGWKTDMRIADDVPDIIYSTHCMESFYGCNKEFCKRKQKCTHRYHA